MLINVIDVKQDCPEYGYLLILSNHDAESRLRKSIVSQSTFKLYYLTKYIIDM